METQLTPLDIAIRDNNINSVIMIMSILLKYQNNTCFNYLIDPQIITLMEKNIDLKDYFESDLPIHQIKDERFPYLHEDSTSKIIGLNANYPQEILTMYESKIGIHFKEDPEEAKTSIEYFFINLPESMTQNPTELINALVQSGNHDYFESLPIQTIIQFKWEKYTRDFFLKQFYFFLIFFFVNFGDIYYSIFSKEIDDSSMIISDGRDPYIYITLKSICGLVLLYFGFHEIRQMKSIREHFSEIWNWTDLLLIVTYFVMAVFDHLQDYYIVTTVL